MFFVVLHKLLIIPLKRDLGFWHLCIEYSVRLSNVLFAFWQNKIVFRISQALFLTSFSHCRILKMPKTWVFSLSFEFFPWVLRVFSWVLSFSLSLGFCFIVFVATVAKLACYIDKLSTQRYVMDIDTKPRHNIHLRWIKTWIQRKYTFFKKCRKFKFWAWVLVFSLSFEFFSPWFFFFERQKKAWVSQSLSCRLILLEFWA